MLSLTLLVAGFAIATERSGGPAAVRAMAKGYGRSLILLTARQAAWAYEERGAEGLDAFINAARPTPETDAVLIDHAGSSLASLPAAPELLGFARSITTLEDPEIDLQGRRMRFAVRIQTASGKPYTAAFQSPVGQFLWGVLDGPTWLLRTGFLLIIGAALCSWLALRITTPLADLGQLTRRFASGDLSARSTKGLARKLPEIEDLARDFDRMAERIESLVQSQQHLLHYVSHELRTPLTRLQLAISLAQQQEGATPAALQATLTRIATEGDRLNDLLDQILRYSQLEASGGQRLRLQPIDWNDFLDSIAADAAFEAEAHARQVILKHVDGGRYQGDRDLLRSAFENVIRNAIRHSPSGGAVEVEQRQQGETVEIAIHDSGPGIAAEELPRIFEPFFRAASSKGTSTGYGLGLAIAKRVASLHKGEVAAENRPHGGLSIRFRFPSQR